MHNEIQSERWGRGRERRDGVGGSEVMGGRKRKKTWLGKENRTRVSVVCVCVFHTMVRVKSVPKTGFWKGMCEYPPENKGQKQTK